MAPDWGSARESGLRRARAGAGERGSWKWDQKVEIGWKDRWIIEYRCNIMQARQIIDGKMAIPYCFILIWPRTARLLFASDGLDALCVVSVCDEVV